MNTTSIAPIDISITLEDLRAVILALEANGGPLVAISPYKKINTWITYADDTPPGKKIHLEVISNNASPPSVDDYQLICIGDCFIQKKATRIAVYRANQATGGLEDD